MKIKLKICGMREPENIWEVASLRPDYMGFIFYEKSPRFVGDNFKLLADFPSDIKRIGVFVNASTDEIMKRVNALSLQGVQLHGNESEEQCLELKEKGLTVIKVFSVDATTDFRLTIPYKQTVDYFLFDTKGKHYGGNAKEFNWSLLLQYDQAVPFFLSGGLSPENIHKVKKLEDMNIYALDLNSGVEESPGIKNIEKIEEVMSVMKSIL